MKNTGCKYAMRDACGLWPNRPELVTLKSMGTKERVYTSVTSFPRTIYVSDDGIEWAMVDDMYYALRYSWRYDARTGKKLVRMIDYQRSPLKPYEV